MTAAIIDVSQPEKAEPTIVRPTHAIAACVFALALPACTHTADLTLATARIVNGDAVVEVALNQRDVQVIKERELYFSIVIVECADKSKRFPLQPHLDGKMIEGGNFPRVESTTVYGTMPERNFQRYGKPCVLLEGGGYFSGRLSSQPVPVMFATASDVAASSTGESFFLEPSDLRQQVALAERGDNRAALRVADHYGLGEGQPAKAYPWFLMAAKRGDIGAMRSLSVYLYAKGGRDNCRQAAKWLEQARRNASPSEFQQYGLGDTFNKAECASSE